MNVRLSELQCFILIQHPSPFASAWNEATFQQRAGCKDTLCWVIRSAVQRTQAVRTQYKSERAFFGPGQRDCRLKAAVVDLFQHTTIFYSNLVIAGKPLLLRILKRDDLKRASPGHWWFSVWNSETRFQWPEGQLPAPGTVTRSGSRTQRWLFGQR